MITFRSFRATLCTPLDALTLFLRFRGIFCHFWLIFDHLLTPNDLKVVKNQLNMIPTT